MIVKDSPVSDNKRFHYADFSLVAQDYGDANGDDKMSELLCHRHHHHHHHQSLAPSMMGLAILIFVSPSGTIISQVLNGYA